MCTGASNFENTTISDMFVVRFFRPISRTSFSDKF